MRVNFALFLWFRLQNAPWLIAAASGTDKSIPSRWGSPRPKSGAI
jgi:hypothetical protein